MSRTRRYSSRKKMYQHRRRVLAFVVVLMIMMIAFLLLPKIGGLQGGGQSPDTPADIPAMAPVENTKKLKISAETAGSAPLTDAYIYGTHLGLAGTLTPADVNAVQSLQLVLRTPDDDEVSWPLQTAAAGGTLTFTLSENINGGVELQDLAEMEGCLLVRAALTDGSAADYLLTAGAVADLPFTYYTVTQNGGNRCITLQREDVRINRQSVDALVLRCAAATLPENVYDFVIDAGHGGTDAGAVAGDVYEADIMLDMALRTRDQLQARGYKVLLTRNGSEDPNTKMAYTMYDENGRVTLTASSGAKLCLSLHLNTYDGYLGPDDGGVQVYAADHMDYTFAQSLASGVASTAGSHVSPMTVFRVAPGVYSRVFTQADSDELDAECAEFGAMPYNIPAGTNYYYIIRETGGRITGAYIDGRHPHYGTNIYRDIPVGVESYLCELGYISLQKDLKNIRSNPDAYAIGLAEAVHRRFETE